MATSSGDDEKLLGELVPVGGGDFILVAIGLDDHVDRPELQMQPFAVRQHGDLRADRHVNRPSL